MQYPWLNEVVFGNTLKSYVLFVGILVLGLILKNLFSRIISKLLFSVFKRFYTESNPVKFLELLLSPIKFLITLMVLYLAINQLDYPINEIIFRRVTYVDKVQKLYTITLTEVLDKVFIFLIILAALQIILRIVDFIAHVFQYKASLTSSKLDDQMVPFLKELSKIVIIVISVFVMMGLVFNLNVAPIVAGLGIGGLAIALAAQDTLQNLLGSFTIFADKPFIVGDLIRVAGYDAVVEKVGFRSTLLRTLDKTLVIIPNKKMIDSPVENLTLRNLRRVEFSIGLTYDTSSDVMKSIAEDIKNYIDKDVNTSNDTIVIFDTFNNSSLDIKILYYIQIVEYDQYMKIKNDINYKVMEIVQNRKAQFAFPTSTVIHQNKEI